MRTAIGETSEYTGDADGETDGAPCQQRGRWDVYVYGNGTVRRDGTVRPASSGDGGTSTSTATARCALLASTRWRHGRRRWRIEGTVRTAIGETSESRRHGAPCQR